MTPIRRRHERTRAGSYWLFPKGGYTQADRDPRFSMRLILTLLRWLISFSGFELTDPVYRPLSHYRFNRLGSGAVVGPLSRPVDQSEHFRVNRNVGPNAFGHRLILTRAAHFVHTIDTPT